MEEPADCPVVDDDECVVCLGARATMQTFPCEHRVVCRKCFIRTIQVAVAQRLLPLRCVVCRARILKLRHAASGSKAVPVVASSPFHSSSAPPSGGGFMVNNNNSNNNNNPHAVNHNRIQAMASLGKVSPCRPVAVRKSGVKSSPSALFVPDPPRVTLTKATPDHFLPLAKSSRVTPRDSSPAVSLTSTSARITSTTTTKTTKTTTTTKPATGSKSAVPNKKGDVISDAHPVSSKGNNSISSRRGRGFTFKPLFWRQ
ncbi:uncharacterized protein [Littorina saxatilis]|uniref:uncharacterized protein n=1 Tax=Littorina saxatilis TaxID=31220 RepID=UPI0038B55E70